MGTALRTPGGGAGFVAMMALTTSMAVGWIKTGYSGGDSFAYSNPGGVGVSNKLTCQVRGRYRIVTRNVNASDGYIRLLINGQNKTDPNSDVEIDLAVGDQLTFGQSFAGTGHNLGCVVVSRG